MRRSRLVRSIAALGAALWAAFRLRTPARRTNRRRTMSSFVRRHPPTLIVSRQPKPRRGVGAALASLSDFYRGFR